jgi:tRNA (guanine37-N1)-methyltransferase
MNLKSETFASFDIIGSREKAVAIVEASREMMGKEADYARMLMQQNESVKTVLAKIGEREGVYRLRRYRLILGDENTEVIHKEHGFRLKLDPRKVYFSPRESTERQRIASQVKDGETVIVMFAGIAPYPIAIAKKKNVEKIVAVELSKEAVNFAQQNVAMNKLIHKIEVIEGDVKIVCEKWYGRFDRVVMPLPKDAENFLETAVKCLKLSGGAINFYSWGRDPELFHHAEQVIDESLTRLGKKYVIINKRVVLPYGPHIFKVCIDFETIGQESE